MSATYDPKLSTDRDWVRYLIGDTTTGSASLSDEEIDALVSEESNKYLAAARALAGLRAKWGALGQGVLEKQVGSLRIRRGTDASADAALIARIAELRARGAADTYTTPKAFKVL